MSRCNSTHAATCSGVGCTVATLCSPASAAGWWGAGPGPAREAPCRGAPPRPRPAPPPAPPPRPPAALVPPVSWALLLRTLKWAVASKCKHRTILAWCCLLLGTKARQNSSSEHISERISTAARQNVQNRCVPTRSMCTTGIILAAALLRHLPRSLLRHLPGGRTQRSVATRSTQRFRKQHPFLCS